MLHTKAFHLHSILEVAKVYRWFHVTLIHETVTFLTMTSLTYPPQCFHRVASNSPLFVPWPNPVPDPRVGININLLTK